MHNINLTGNFPAIARIILGTSINPRPFQYFNVIAELEKADMIMIMSKTN
jgi:hypothetical protein